MTSSHGMHDQKTNRCFPRHTEAQEKIHPSNSGVDSKPVSSRQQRRNRSQCRAAIKWATGDRQGIHTHTKPHRRASQFRIQTEIFPLIYFPDRFSQQVSRQSGVVS